MEAGEQKVECHNDIGADMMANTEPTSTHTEVLQVTLMLKLYKGQKWPIYMGVWVNAGFVQEVDTGRQYEDGRHQTDIVFHLSIQYSSLLLSS